MVKDAKFSFFGDLPKFKPTRHCCGIVINRKLYLVLSTLTTIQILCILIFFLSPNHRKLANLEDEDDRIVIAIIATSSVWLCTILFSFIGFYKNFTYLQIPLMIMQIIVSLLLLLLIAAIAWSISLDFRKKEPKLQKIQFQCIKIAFFGIFLIFHLYYTMCLYYLCRDIQKRQEADDFIRRQHMIDDVCEEMLWEEHQANRYPISRNLSPSSEVEGSCDDVYEELMVWDEDQPHGYQGNRTFPPAGIYRCRRQESVYSRDSSSRSELSAELTINTMYYDPRIVSFDNNGHTIHYY